MWLKAQASKTSTLTFFLSPLSWMPHKHKLAKQDSFRILKRVCTIVESLLRDQLSVPREAALDCPCPVSEQEAREFPQAVVTAQETGGKVVCSTGEEITLTSWGP